MATTEELKRTHRRMQHYLDQYPSYGTILHCSLGYAISCGILDLSAQFAMRYKHDPDIVYLPAWQLDVLNKYLKKEDPRRDLVLSFDDETTTLYGMKIKRNDEYIWME